MSVMAILVHPSFRKRRIESLFRDNRSCGHYGIPYHTPRSAVQSWPDDVWLHNQALRPPGIGTSAAGLGVSSVSASLSLLDNLVKSSQEQNLIAFPNSIPTMDEIPTLSDQSQLTCNSTVIRPLSSTHPSAPQANSTTSPVPKFPSLSAKQPTPSLPS